jgi:hypothetical protein
MLALEVRRGGYDPAYRWVETEEGMRAAPPLAGLRTSSKNLAFLETWGPDGRAIGAAGWGRQFRNGNSSRAQQFKQSSI